MQNITLNVVFTGISSNTNAMTAYNPIIKGSLYLIRKPNSCIQCVMLSRTSVLITSLQFGHTIRFGLLVISPLYTYFDPKTTTFRSVDLACFPIDNTGCAMRNVDKFERSSELAVLPSCPLSVNYCTSLNLPSLLMTFAIWLSTGDGTERPSEVLTTNKGLLIT